MLVLAIDTSCDDTAAAVIGEEGEGGGRKLLSNVVSSQIAVHQKYGGVVPELASRKHLESIVPIVTEALRTAGTTLSDINGIAVTQGPGLVGSLLVGLSFAKSLAFVTGIPFVGVNHIEGHLSAIFLEKDPPPFPFVGLVVIRRPYVALSSGRFWKIQAAWGRPGMMRQARPLTKLPNS